MNIKKLISGLIVVLILFSILVSIYQIIEDNQNTSPYMKQDGYMMASFDTLDQTQIEEQGYWVSPYAKETKNNDGSFTQRITTTPQAYYDENGDLEEIDSIIVTNPKNEPLYDYGIEKGAYNVFFKQDPTEKNTIKFYFKQSTLYPSQDEEGFIILQANELSYRNNQGDTQLINKVKPVSGFALENEFFYKDIYGSGISLSYEYLSSITWKKLQIEDPSCLPKLEQQILNKGEVTIDLDMTLKWKDDLQIFVNGDQWDGIDEIFTTGDIDFKDVESGQTMFYLPSPLAWDNNNDIKHIQYVLKKQNDIIFLTVKTPYSWIMDENTQYPIIIDATFSSDNPTEDGYIQRDSYWDTYYKYETEKTLEMGRSKYDWDPDKYTYRRSYIEWDISSIPDDSEIVDTVFKYDCARGAGGGFPNCQINDINNRPSTTLSSKTIYDDIGSGITFYSGKFTGFPEEGSNKEVDLGNKADNNLQERLSDDWWAIGIQSMDETKGYLQIYSEDNGSLTNPKPTLFVTYNEPSPSQLEIQTLNEVEEELDFIVGVTADNIPIENVIITFSGSTYITSVDGTVAVTAPSVDQDTSYILKADKSGYLSDQKSILVTDSAIPIEQPQLIITTPSHVIEGDNFQVILTADDKPVESVMVNFTGITFFTTNEGSVTITAPSVEEDTSYLITAYKSGYLQAETIITVAKISIPTEDPHLVITAPSSITEEESFLVTVTSDNIPVENAEVSFYGTISNTKSDGTVSITAPLVDEDIIYPISASKTGYQASSASITVIDKGEEISESIIYGVVYDVSSNLIEDAEVCVLTSVSEIINKCTFTNKDGEYMLTVTPGVQIIKASKQGYKTNTTIISINENTNIKVDFILEKETEDQIELVSDENKILFDYVISDEADKGNAGAKINVDTKEILLFSEELSLTIEESESDIFSFTVSAPEGTGKKIIFIEVGSSTFSNIKDLNNIIIEYDDVVIERKSLTYIINSDDTSDPVWAGLLSIENNGKTTPYFAIVIPSFSEHTITISTVQVVEIEEVVDTISIILSYIFICIVIAVLVVAPILYIERKK